MDETSKQLVSEVRTPIPCEPGEPARHDSEYVREGVANLFLFFEPLTGQRRVEVTERRTMIDWAEAVRDLVDVQYSEAHKIVLALDSLNTHSMGLLYEAFPPAEAARISRKLEFHYTPKHGRPRGERSLGVPEERREPGARNPPRARRQAESALGRVGISGPAAIHESLIATPAIKG